MLLYADENVPGPVVEELRALGHEVFTVRENGQANRCVADRDVLAFAAARGWAVLTRNGWDYVRLHQEFRPHAGIIVCAEDLAFAAQARKVHRALLGRPTLANQLVRVTRS
ncbi:MAG TPA: DUF5615 family PIN-like protein [Gemmataceae bacterium]|nr:DUF5615 family PIN-like protein [Gemmataceae bacterium]